MDFFDFQEKTKRDAVPKAAESAAPSVAGEMTVSQLTARIERALQADFPGPLLVRGEVSNLKHHRQSGHLYFTLKDPQACIDCVMFRSDAARLKFKPADGMELLVRVRLGVFAQRGRYQLYVTSLQPVGQGALELAFQQLRQRLEAEGLFAAERKRPLPRYPRRIVLLTSKETAALQDMLKVLRPYSWLKLLIYHVPVQGDGAGQAIAAAIAQVNRCAAQIGGVDLILLGRGGGSLEDLWAFNEEAVARAVAASQIPIITGIGHEVDVSIADLAADYHAHTPTEAAQVATRHWRAVRDLMETSGLRLRRGLRGIVEHARQRLMGIERHELFRRPKHRIDMLRQMLDHRQRALALVMVHRLRDLHRQVHKLGQRLERHRPAEVFLRLRHDLERLSERLHERHPRHLIRLHRHRVDGLAERMHRGMSALQHRRQRQIEALAAHLNAIGPEQVLKRGYSITMMKKSGKVVRQSDQVKPGDRLLTRLADGQIESVAEDRRQLPLFE